MKGIYCNTNLVSRFSGFIHTGGKYNCLTCFTLLSEREIEISRLIYWTFLTASDEPPLHLNFILLDLSYFSLLIATWFPISNRLFPMKNYILKLKHIKCINKTKPVRRFWKVKSFNQHVKRKDHKIFPSHQFLFFRLYCVNVYIYTVRTIYIYFGGTLP